MPPGTPHFPDAAIRLAPCAANNLAKSSKHARAGLVDNTAIGSVGVCRKNNLAINIKLLLGMRTVPDANRARTSITGKVRKLMFVEATTTVDVVHHP